MNLTEAIATVKEPSSYSLAILRGMQNKPVWQGNYDGVKKARRRTANKVARRARRSHR